MRTEALQMLSTGLSPSEVATRLNINPATVRVWKSRANTDKVKQPTETAIPAPPKVRKPQPEQRSGALDFGKPETGAPNRNFRILTTLRKIVTRSNAIDTLLVSVIVGHSALVWYDCGQMWGMPGAIGGGVTFLIVLAALLLASDETKPRTSNTALWFIFLIDVAAWRVHFLTFKKYADIGSVETGMFAGFLCACSFAALYIFRDSKLD